MYCTVIIIIIIIIVIVIIILVYSPTLSPALRLRYVTSWWVWYLFMGFFHPLCELFISFGNHAQVLVSVTMSHLVRFSTCCVNILLLLKSFLNLSFIRPMPFSFLVILVAHV